MSYTKLYRSPESKVLGGVCGGLGEYFSIDPNLVRVGAVLLFLATQGFAVIAYIVGWIIIPKRPVEAQVTESLPDRPHSSWTGYLPGLVLIVLGAILLIREHWFWFDFHEWWPVLLIVAGLVLVFHKRHRRECAEARNGYHRESQAENGGSVS